MRLKSFLLISSFTLAACSTAATQDETQGNSTATASGTGTETGVTNGTTTGGPTGTTSDSPTTGLASETDGTDSGTNDTTPLTSSSTTSTEPQTTGETTFATESGTSTAGETTTGDETTTGGMGGGPCEVDADCQLHDDCCSCYGVPVGQDDGACDEMCDQTQCKQIGIEKAVCRLGQCTTEKVDCSSPVVCDSLPPECPEGTLPGISEGCWSGACVPVISCDAVPDCAACPDSQLCVEYEALIVSHTCLPKPDECGDKVNCACAEAACDDLFSLCQESMGEADLVCSCPNC